jgi:hypothetical protein
MDHARVNINNSNISCGVKELSRMSDEAKENLFAIGSRFYHPAHGQPPAFCVWSNLDGKEGTEVNGGEGTNGHRLAAAIDKLGFGKVAKSDPAINPNTGSVIAVWTWLVDHETFKKWYKEQKIEKLKSR